MPLGRRDALTLAAVGVGAAAAGALVGALALQSGSGAAGLLAATFHDLEGRPRRLREWRGRALLCNFWATWCAPCREEIPLLVTAKQKFTISELEIVGIGIDSADKIRDFAAIYKISYPLLVADATIIPLLRGLGNSAGGLPYTVGLDRNGALVYQRLGALQQPDLQKVLESLVG